MFERLRAAINAALDAATPPEDPRAFLALMREAVIDARASIEAMREGVAQTDGRLAHERKRLEDAERRGRLAAGIEDAETIEVAKQFATKHRERVEVLEQKLVAQQEELALAEREYGDMKSKLKHAERDRVTGDAARHVESAWRNVEVAGGARPDSELDESVLGSRMDRAAREAEAEDQLEELKRRMGRD